ncbi:MAG: phytanoyl-CoA dioxygenase protein 1 isoform [Chthonomonadales bacterium]|nr:phytanoyl-CoA dioxygenase protein 1 isoform [Chthonomonadales bacterium]
MSLSTQQLQQFRQDGFVILPEFFSLDALQPVIAEIDGLVDRLAERLYAAGKITDRHAEAGFATRLALLEQEYVGAAVLIHIGGILGPALAHLWETPRLLDIIEQLIGPEVAGHPVWNLRSKTPHNPLVTVPWHQDTAYLAEGAEATLQPTAWIPLVDANRVNGTLQVVRGGHLPGKLGRHHLESTRGHKDSWYLYLPDEELPEGEIVTCEMPRGSVLLFNQLLPHRSTENLSDSVRWSLDLRWQRPDEPSGFEGVKDCILMRTAHDPNYRPDWEAWSRQNRITDAMLDTPQDEFDATVSGPWMERWKD